ncbi:MAG: MBL fold metallo-hydrolase [Thiotrichaceae bacterium]|nr:MBL fold metallo-hydrolase [Thiotrichaceae bacterium]
MLKFASIGSGSRGNGLIVESATGRILLDCGFSLKETEHRLNKLDCPPDSLDGIVVSHEHGDHITGVGRLSRKYKLPVWITVGTYNAAKDNRFYQTYFFKADDTLTVGDLTIQPFAVPHDASEPCQFVFSSNQQSLGVLTDTGHITPIIIERLSQMNALLLEYNYDEHLLVTGKYPYNLKQRVGGKYGHLENNQSTSLMSQIDCSHLQCLVAMHLSENNNDSEKVNALLENLSFLQVVEKYISSQKDGFNWKIIENKG